MQTSSRTNIQFLVFHLTLADTIVSLGSLACLRWCVIMLRSNKDSWQSLCEEAISKTLTDPMTGKLSKNFCFIFFYWPNKLQKQTLRVLLFRKLILTIFLYLSIFSHNATWGSLEIHKSGGFCWQGISSSRKVFPNFSGRRTILAASFWWLCERLDITSPPVFLSSSVWTGGCVITSLQKGSLHRMQSDTQTS